MRRYFVTLSILFTITLLTSFNAFGSAIKHTGTVAQVINTSGYTYIELEEKGEKFWVASTQTSVKTGDKVEVASDTWMQNFRSTSLNRTFEKILFADGLIVNGKGIALETEPAESIDEYEGHSAPAGFSHSQAEAKNDNHTIPASEKADAPAPHSIEKVKGGLSVEEVYSKKDALNGKEVKVKGKVVKVSKGILGMSWIHIQDGTGNPETKTNDITFTSKTESAEVNSIVIAKGILTINKDFGAGYTYPAIIEDSKFEKAE